MNHSQISVVIKQRDTMHIKVCYLFALAIVLGLTSSCSNADNKNLVGENRSNQHQIVSTLKKIREAQKTYKATNNTYGSMENLIESQLVDKAIANNDYYGYQLEIRNNTNTTYEVIAL